ncbi:MAG: sce7726 family protein [Streptococcaceae bacterium]|jgi:hypothetical protein|nr:sce7726 family protein [Streptococcaceae bacterium]MCH4176177.1 sce7726 family protein [Streptococcaceae bacterium]
MKDKDIRNLTLRELYQLHDGEKNTRIINEMGLINGESRIDIAVVNGILHGYELKSESDNLSRLPQQIENYNKIFERMTIVTDQKYIKEVKKIIPSWWGIMTVRKDKKGLRELRKGRKVKTQDEEALLNLLWKNEYNELIDLLGYPKKIKSYRKQQLFDIILKDNRKSIIKKYIYDTLRKRNYN